MEELQFKNILLSQEEIGCIVAQLADEINADYQHLDSELLVVGLLKGSFIFMADLVRQIKAPLVLDFMAVTSYGNATSSSGEVRFLLDIQNSIAGRHVLIIEDIIDTGRTLKKVISHLHTGNPKSVKTCTLLDKPGRRQVEVVADYVGKEIPDEFVCGYGLDFAQKYRNLPHIFVLKKSGLDKDEV